MAKGPGSSYVGWGRWGQGGQISGGPHPYSPALVSVPLRPHDCFGPCGARSFIMAPWANGVFTLPCDPSPCSPPSSLCPWGHLGVSPGTSPARVSRGLTCTSSLQGLCLPGSGLPQEARSRPRLPAGPCATLNLPVTAYNVQEQFGQGHSGLCTQKPKLPRMTFTLASKGTRGAPEPEARVLFSWPGILPKFEFVAHI